MEKVMSQSEINTSNEKVTISKSVIKSEIKSMKKISKIYRALQIIKYNSKIYGYRFVKRSLDIVAGIFGTILLIPIMGIVKIAYLKQGDYAPILFKQKRIGKDGREIYIYKIRSMVPNAEEVLKKLMKENPRIKAEYCKNKKLKNDPRITKIGMVLRKTSLDEFGQFINVLKGDMTLIGPRPYLPREKEDIGEYYDDIIACKPALGGLCAATLYVENRVLNLCRGGA